MNVSTKDYVFRIVALIVVWAGLLVPSVKDGLFLINDRFDLTIATLVLFAFCVMTFIVWCGPDVVRRRQKEEPAPPPSVPHGRVIPEP